MVSWPLPQPSPLAVHSLAAHIHFSITRAFPSNCRSISKDGRNFSLVRSELFSQTGYQGMKLHAKLYYYKNWDPRARISLIPRYLCSYFFYWQPKLCSLLSPKLQRTIGYSHSPVFYEQYGERLMGTGSRSSP